MDTRDADGDGIYCEALPCPCLKPGDEQTSLPHPPPPKDGGQKTPKKRARVIKASFRDVVAATGEAAQRARAESSSSGWLSMARSVASPVPHTST